MWQQHSDSARHTCPYEPLLEQGDDSERGAIDAKVENWGTYNDYCAEIKRQLLLYHQGGQRSKPAHLRTASVTTMLVSSRMTSPAEVELSGVNGTSDYEQCNHIVLHAMRLCGRKAHYTAAGCELPETQFNKTWKTNILSDYF